jgi:hypothetical protein
MKYSVFISIFFLMIAGCDGGLTPPPPIEPGFGGTIRFAKNTWPPGDSLANLWLFASKIYPLDSSLVFTGIFSDPPQILVYPSLIENLPMFRDSITYALPATPATFKYIGIIQHFRTEYTIRSMRVVGLYIDPQHPGQNGTVVVGENEFVGGIDINVDFHNPPPQPF